MANSKLLTLLLGTGVTLSSIAHAESVIDNDEHSDNERPSYSVPITIDDLFNLKENMINGSCGNGSCSNNGSC